MRQKSMPGKEPATQIVKNIRRATRRHFSAEDKIRIVLEGLRGEDSIAELCRRKSFLRRNSESTPPTQNLSKGLAAEFLRFATTTMATLIGLSTRFAWRASYTSFMCSRKSPQREPPHHSATLA